MSNKSAVLTDLAESVWLDAFELRESADLRLRGSSDWSIRKRTLRGGVSDGVDVVELNNGMLSVSILPTRGMGLWRGRYRELEIGWNSPVKQPVNPAFVDLSDRNGLGWLAGPFIENVPRESLNFTLTATREALIKKFRSESSK